MFASSVTDRDILNITSNVDVSNTEDQIASTSSSEKLHMVNNPSAAENSCKVFVSPEKEKFEMKHMEKKQKEEKKRKSEEAKIQAATKTLLAKKRKAVKEDYTSSEEEEEEEISLDDSSDDATYWFPEVEPSAFKELDRDPNPMILYWCNLIVFMFRELR
ncbi:hypothetical protein FQA39_LY11475 [Lamprigera yunnana]|nr:hypothetical protein FQA39_LY11475 [Lamprigera yunnana]